MNFGKLEGVIATLFQAPGLRLFNMQESQKVGTLGNPNQVGAGVLYLLVCLFIPAAKLCTRQLIITI